MRQGEAGSPVTVVSRELAVGGFADWPILV